MKLRNTLLGSTLLVAAFGSSALSLGRARGAVVLGQPLDLLVDVRLDQADDAVGQCFDAEVFHADSRVDGNRVQVTVQNVTPALGAVVRIRSSAIVDEPVLSVTLRSTCGQTASRRYDFLTDFPVETRSSAVPTVIPSAVTTGSSSAAPVPQDAPAGIASAPGASAAPAPAPIRVAPTPAPAPVPRAVVAPRPPRPAAAVAARPPAAVPLRAREQQQTARTAQASASEAAQSRPRLRLDAATVAEDRLVPLKSSSELLSAPTDNAQQRAEATAAWRSLNQLPAENPQDEKDRLRLQALEAEGKALKAQLAKNEEDFRLRLERLEANRYDSNIVYLLLALLFAALLAAAFFWNRARKSVALVADWSRQNDPQVAAADAAALAVQAGTVNSRQAPLEPEYTAATRNPTRPAPLAPAVPVAKVADPEIDESLFQDLKKLNTITLPQVRPAASASLGAPAAGHAARGLSPEDFFDVQQHADFFVSLGQYDQAIDVLKKNIDENIEVSPLAYLELLKIYHTLSRQDDYNHLRDDFNRIFNGNVPPFASFNDEGRGLEDYPSALLAIENNWGTPQVLDVIESNLYRAPGASSGPAYDLAAYREFLLLYAIAKTMVRRSGTSSVDIPLGRVTREAPLAATAPAVPLNAADATNAALAASMVAHPPVSRPPPPSFENSLSALLLDEPVSPEPSVGDSPTQPMLLMADTSMPPVQPASGVDIPSYKQPLDLDLDLDLNLDFSNSELQVMGHSHDVSAPPLPMLDLPESFPPSPPAGSPAPADVPPGFPPSTGLDSNLIEFDLFDPSIEAKISPKSK